MMRAVTSSSRGLNRRLSSSSSNSSFSRRLPSSVFRGGYSATTTHGGQISLRLAAASFSSHIDKFSYQQKACRGSAEASRHQERQKETLPSEAAVKQAADLVPNPAPASPGPLAPPSRRQSSASPPQGLIPFTLLPLDLGTYHSLLSRSSTMPSEALVLLQEMQELGLTVDPPALLSAMRICGRHPAYLQQCLKLHDQVMSFPLLCASPSFFSSSPLVQTSANNKTHFITTSYALVLSACLRAGGSQGYDAAHLFLEQMKEGKVAPTLLMYSELAKACLVVIEDKRERDDEREEEARRALKVFQEVMAMIPAEEEGKSGGGKAAETKGPDSALLSSSVPSTYGVTCGKQLNVKCKSESEAQWVHELIALKARGDVGQALVILAQGLTAFCSSETEGGREGEKEEEAVPFACNVVLSTCIRTERWKEAGQVRDLMQGLGVPPDAFTLNSLLAHSLRQHQHQHQQAPYHHNHHHHKGHHLNQQQQEIFSPSLPPPPPPVVLVKELVSAFPSLTPNPNTFRAVLDVCGIDSLLDLCTFMQAREGRMEGGVGIGMGVGTYRLLLQALEEREGGEGVKIKGLPLLARVVQKL